MDFPGKQRRISPFCTTAQFLDQTTRNSTTDQTPSPPSSPAGLQPGNLSPQLGTFPQQSSSDKTTESKVFYLHRQWRAAPRKGASLQTTCPKPMLKTSIQPGGRIAEPHGVSNKQKPTAPQPYSYTELFFPAPASLRVDLCLLRKLIMKQ